MFPRYSFRHVQHRYIWLPLLRLTPDGKGFPGNIFYKILHGGQRIARVKVQQQQIDNVIFASDRKGVLYSSIIHQKLIDSHLPTR